MVLENKGVYDNLHTLHPMFTLVTLVVWMGCDTHYTVYSFVYICIWYISYTRLFDSCEFRDPIPLELFV